METRRIFLGGLLATVAASGFVIGLAKGQNPVGPSERRAPKDATSETPPLPSAEKRLLDENEKDIKKKVEKLYELATELKTEVEKTDSSKVLNLSVLRKAEEIEKLAREIKNRSKG